PGVPAHRRVAVILGYAVLLLLALFVTLGMQISTACLEDDVCSAGENLSLTAAAFGMILGVGILVVAGWRGRLPGARGHFGEGRD
ncbi:MAG: hypothetical protein P8174_08850, partial [Gemmatimonadota bacterium]